MLGCTITTRSMCSALCSAAISEGSAISGVYERPSQKGNCFGSPKMCVWQSQACSGISKFTAVFGCEAFAKSARAGRAAAAV